MPGLILPEVYIASMRCEDRCICTAILAVFAILVAHAYGAGTLNYLLPACIRKRGDTFVGSMGRNPGMQSCLVAPTGSNMPAFNRCGYV